MSFAPDRPVDLIVCTRSGGPSSRKEPKVSVRDTRDSPISTSLSNRKTASVSWSMPRMYHGNARHKRTRIRADWRTCRPSLPSPRRPARQILQPGSLMASSRERERERAARNTTAPFCKLRAKHGLDAVCAHVHPPTPWAGEIKRRGQHFNLCARCARAFCAQPASQTTPACQPCSALKPNRAAA